MSSEETRLPVPTAISSSYATDYNKAERALQDPQPAICRASLRLSCSNGVYVAEVSRETMSYTGYFAFLTLLSGRTETLERSGDINL
jgi:hypothetical protein